MLDPSAASSEHPHTAPFTASSRGNTQFALGSAIAARSGKATSRLEHWPSIQLPINAIAAKRPGGELRNGNHTTKICPPVQSSGKFQREWRFRAKNSRAPAR